MPPLVVSGKMSAPVEVSSVDVVAPDVDEEVCGSSVSATVVGLAVVDVEPMSSGTHSFAEAVYFANRRPLSQLSSGKLHPPLASQIPSAPQSPASEHRNVGPAPHPWAALTSAAKAIAVHFPPTSLRYPARFRLETALVAPVSSATLCACPITSCAASQVR